MFEIDSGLSKMAVADITNDIPTSFPPNAFELFDTDRYWSTYYEGFGRPKATLNLNESPTGNYSEFESASITDRTLEFDLYPQGDAARNIQLLNRNLPFGKLRRFYICTADHRACYIDGITESLPDDVKAGNLRNSDVVIRCPFPWFTGLRRYEKPVTSETIYINNNGDISAGFSLYVTEPITVNRFTLADENGSYFTLVNQVAFDGNANDDIPAYRSVDGKHDAFDGNGNSTIGAMLYGSTFWKLQSGENVVHVSSELVGKCKIVWNEYYSYAVM